MMTPVDVWFIPFHNWHVALCKQNSVAYVAWISPTACIRIHAELLAQYRQ